MSETHYFNAPAGQGAVESHPYEVAGYQLYLKTSAGIFAKRGFDPGSRLLLETIYDDAVMNAGYQPERILDLGCGNGVLAIFLSEFFPEARLDLTDVSPRALEIATLNTKQRPRLRVHQSDGLEIGLDLKLKLGCDRVDLPCFDLVVTNPPIRAGKATCYRLYREVSQVLKPEGRFYLVVRKKQGALSHAKYLADLFTEVTMLRRDKGYHIYRCSQSLEV